MFPGQRESTVLGQQSFALGISPVCETETPRMYSCMGNMASPLSDKDQGNVSPDMMPLLGDQGQIRPVKLLVA
jgi:hypothetical protein